jgi:gliding motility-associated-like protein
MFVLVKIYYKTMKHIVKYLLVFIFIALYTNSEAQTKKPLKELSNTEYQQLKSKGLLPKLYPEQFKSSKKIVSNKNKKAKNGLKHSNLQKVNASKALFQTSCFATSGYQPPIEEGSPVPDFNGDLVSDTIVQFTNGVPPFYTNDDGSTTEMSLPFGFCFYGQTYNSLFVNNNGNISVNAAYSNFSGSDFPNTEFVMIAPFWADVDTRGTGLVYIRRMPTYTIIKWHEVGYFNSQTDKVNSFMLVLTNGTSPIVPNGNNVGFFYGDMQWTTGSQSGGVNGFGGRPATVGANQGNGVDYIQFGRFDQPGTAYDGPNGDADGVSWLDNQTFFFSACNSSNNVPPIVTGIQTCDTLKVCVGDNASLDFGFLAPEVNQEVNVVVSNNNNPGITYSINNATPSSPTVTFNVSGLSNNVGTYTYTIYATDNGLPILNSDTINLTIVIQPSPIFTTQILASSCTGNNGSFQVNLSSGTAPYSYSLVTGNGTTTQTSPVFSGLAPNTYTVLVNDNNACSSSSQVTIQNGILPDIPAYAEVCYGDTLILLGNPDIPGASYLWTGPNGFTDTNRVAYVFNAQEINEGFYSLKIDLNNCPGILDSIFFLVGFPIVNVGADLQACESSSVALTGTVEGLFSSNTLWYALGNGPGTFTTPSLLNTNYSLTTANNTAGFVDIVLKSGPIGCQEYDTLRINIEQPATVEAGLSVTTCEGSSINLLATLNNSNATVTWNQPAGISGEISNPNSVNTSYVLNNINNVTIVPMTVTANPNGEKCPNVTDVVNVTVNPLPDVESNGGGVKGTQGTVCDSTSAFIKYIFTGKKPFRFKYNNGFGVVTDSTLNNEFNVGYDFIFPNLYSFIELTDSNNCRTTSGFNADTVRIRPRNYTFTFLYDSAKCGVYDGRIITTVATNLTQQDIPYKYTWKSDLFADGIDSIYVRYPIATIDTIKSLYAGEYYLTIKDTVGCEFLDTALVPVKKNIKAKLNASKLEGESLLKLSLYNLSVGDSIEKYIWSYGDGTPDFTSTTKDSVFHTFKADFDTSYIVKIKAISLKTSDCNDEDTLRIRVKVPSDVMIPNVFTPNGDKSNDGLKINPSGVRNISAQIFDRWGKKVHTYENPGANDWDGNIWDGTDFNDGTYYYVITYSQKESGNYKERTKTGFLHILK